MRTSHYVSPYSLGYSVMASARRAIFAAAATLAPGGCDAAAARIDPMPDLAPPHASPGTTTPQSPPPGGSLTIDIAPPTAPKTYQICRHPAVCSQGCKAARGRLSPAGLQRLSGGAGQGLCPRRAGKPGTRRDRLAAEGIRARVCARRTHRIRGGGRPRDGPF